MTIRIVGYNPLKVTVENVETPVITQHYLDENGDNQEISYVVVEGEKRVVQHRIELMEKLKLFKMDEAISKVQEARLKNIAAKDPQPEKPK